MAEKVIVENGEWNREENRFTYCEALEEGHILFFPSIPFSMPQEEIDFLLKQRQSGSAARKNIAYKPQEDRITNHDTKDAERLKEVLKNYSKRVSDFCSILLSPYANEWKLDYASFRPFQEKGRKLRVRARNDLLHVDAFPTRPVHGARILRFFTNINPVEGRRWITSKSAGDLMKEFGGDKGVAFPASMGSSLKRDFKKWLKRCGVKVALRSPYDQFMLQMHNFLKENETFQRECPKDHWDFPPHSCWAVFTDQVSHAALSGQYALEQTFLIPRYALLCPEKAPVSLLERLTGGNMVDTRLAATLFR